MTAEKHEYRLIQYSISFQKSSSVLRTRQFFVVQQISTRFEIDFRLPNEPMALATGLCRTTLSGNTPDAIAFGSGLSNTISQNKCYYWTCSKTGTASGYRSRRDWGGGGVSFSSFVWNLTSRLEFPQEFLWNEDRNCVRFLVDE